MNTLRLIAGISAFLGVTIECSAAVDYNDVAVVVNTNSSVSQSIGSYFKAARSIPDKNFIYVTAPTTEEIDSTAFEDLRGQIEAYLTTHNLANKINYIVTTKGLPIKVNRGSTTSTNSPSSSVQSELTCILGPNSSAIGKAGKVQSPYYYMNAHFSHSTYGIYLVTHLDGYSLQDVYDLIDRSGPGVTVDPAAPFVLDQDPAWNASLPFLNNYLKLAQSTLVAKGWGTLLNSDSVFVTHVAGVLGYMSWGSNDHYAAQFTTNAIPHNAYASGAIAETYVSTSARSFLSPPAYGQSLIADLIQEGVSGAKGYVYEPYSGAMAVAFILFDRYTSGYNLAESFYMASSSLSWMDLVVGDPKTSIVPASQPIGPLPIQLSSFAGSRQEGSAVVRLTWTTLSEKDNFGFFIQRRAGNGAFADIAGAFIAGHGTTLRPQSYTWIDSVAPGSACAYRLEQVDLDGSNHYSDEQLIPAASGRMADQPTDQFSLEQNYPNPFNPSTRIDYALKRTGIVVLKVYDGIGREVATLVNGEQDAGSHSAVFTIGASQGRIVVGSGGGRASGVYYYRLTAEGRTRTRQMLCIK